MIITDCLKSAVVSLVDGKKYWTGIAQWLTLLVPAVLTIKPNKRGRPETTPKKATKRWKQLEKHTQGWTLEGSSQREETQTSRRQEPTEKAPETPAKQISRTQVAVEKPPTGHKLIKFTLRRQEWEAEDFVRRIRQEATKEEALDEPTKTLERHPKKRNRENG